MSGDEDDSPGARIARAMMGYDAVGASIGGPVPDGASRPAHLQAMAKAAYAGYQATATTTPVGCCPR